MENITCKTCGGSVTRSGNYYVCEWCRNKWEIDTANDVHAVERANAWAALRNNDFERAVTLFEEIILKEKKNHEAYWGRALATNAITYVNDLVAGKKIPTCNNITEESFLQSKDVQTAISLAPSDIAASYKQQADYIEKVRLEWLEKARKEPAYDVFISFKDSDRENGIERTQDSIDAQDLYNALVAEGYKVFFSRVSLRNKVSEQYEPYIYNALKTAKVMIVFGEKPAYFNAVWVKNEWTRFAARIEKGEKQRGSLVVAYKNMNPGDLPAQLRGIQCLNAADMTFFSALNEHIRKVIKATEEAGHLDRIDIKGGQISKKATRIANESIEMRELGAGATARTDINDKQMLDLARSYVGGQQWEDAAKLVEQVILHDPNYADAIWQRLLIKHRLRNPGELLKKISSFDAEDFHTIERVLNCADKTFAANVLNLLYQADQAVTEDVYQRILKVILPFNFPQRETRIKEDFETAIQKDHYKIFTTLLSTLSSDDVDAYIKYNLRFAMTSRTAMHQAKCVEAVLAVDAGNLDALHLRIDLLWKTGTADGLKAAFEEILKYAKKPQKEVELMLARLTETLETEAHCAFAKQVLKYFKGELKSILYHLINIAKRMISKGYFDAAQYFLGLALSVEESSPEIYWALCLVKTKSKSANDIPKSDIPLKSVPEYTKYLTLVDENRRQQCFALEKKQKSKQSWRRTWKKIKWTLIGIIAAVIAIATTVTIVNYVDASDKYEQALQCIEDGKYTEAYSLLNDVYYSGYKRDEAYDAMISMKPPVIERAKKHLEKHDYKAALKEMNDVGGNSYRMSYGDFYNMCQALNEGNYKTALDYAEKAKYSLTTIVIPEGTTEIKAYAFSDCDGLTEIVIPNSVTAIGNYAFQKCTSLKTITIPQGITLIGTGTFYQCDSLTSVTLSDRINYISSDAFYDCDALTTINIPSIVTYIGSNAFYGCESLQSITIPKNLENLGSDAFSYCDGLTEINFNATELGDFSTYATPFDAAGTKGSGITLHIDANVSRLPKNLFYTTGSSYSSSRPKITAVIFDQNSVCKSINDYAFYGWTALTSITIPESVTAIGDSAFSGCTALTSITIPESVTSIGSSAFYNCTSLTSVTIPESVTSIGKSAFDDCSSLTSVTIPESVTSIGTYAFSGCTALTQINFNATAMNDLSQKNNAFYNAGINGNGITVNVGANVTKIPAYLFNPYSGSYVPKLTAVNFAAGSVCKSIGAYAFYNCSTLSSITLPASLESIGTYAFYYCSSLKSITIPESVTSIGNDAFYNCTALTEINFNATAMNDLSSSNYVFANAGKNGNGITVSVGANVTKIPAYLFYPYSTSSLYTPMLAAVTFAEGSVCKSIGAYAFYNCTTLSSITLPASLESIGTYAFYNCSSLKSITIPASVSKIDSYAFYCSSLTSATFKQPSGWSRYSSSYSYSGTALDSTSLANTSTAATWLKTTYENYYWRRS